MSGKAERDLRLQALWNRRDGLDRAEWYELYGLVAAILQKEAHRSHGLPGDHDDYVHGFFVDKVMQSATGRLEREMGGDYLLGFFRNYLRDQHKKEHRRPLGHSDSLDSGQADDDDDKALAAAALPDCKRFDLFEDSLEEALALRRLGRAELTASAQAFFARLDHWQQQVLARHLCADAWQALPLSQLQRAFPQASYYKVQQLGVLRATGHLPAGYHKTQIGRWLTRDLKLTLTKEDYPALEAALQVLCLVASQAAEGGQPISG